MVKSVHDLMTHDVRAESPETPALLAAERMARNHIRHLVAIDEIAGTKPDFVNLTLKFLEDDGLRDSCRNRKWLVAT